MPAPATGIIPLLARHPELGELRSRLTAFLDTHLPAPVREDDPRPDWLALRAAASAAGLTGIDVAFPDVPDEGPGVTGRVAQGMAMFLAGQRDCDARELFSTGHAAMPLRYGSPALARHTREQVVTAGKLVGVAASEPHSGSDLRGFRTVLVDHGDHFTLSGSKGLLSRVEEAYGFVVFCKLVDRQDVGRVDLRTVPLSAVWVPMDATGVLTETTDPLGMRGWSFGHLHFVDTRLDKDFLLGEPGDGRRIFDAHFSAWRLMMSLVCLGAAAAAIQESAARTRSRTVGRMPLAGIPSVVARLGTAAAEVEAATAWCFALLERIDQGESDIAACSAAKALATDAAYRAVDLALQLHGSEGYTRQTPMEKRLRDIRGLRIADGPNDTLYSVLAHSLLIEQQRAEDAQLLAHH
ncbi:alkylation response protein AidB-like acyl-CoA dehydrogenase [Kitasatospora sp. MAP12-15]|uniref:acyl-CoA dehydrogenase family protein n=1 Tax=unclassified Kitasatospora TaxID=2633591 RepID=UPI0024754AEC|nr:acyl-CoA dehydrogenase [Kitasatospora sp. MAP12-44]MDH6108389.1 alkylation response protein AidB-like acyl-CoA dehydrogenase [Kitasatospora sp. MAP12-44]